MSIPDRGQGKKEKVKSRADTELLDRVEELVEEEKLDETQLVSGGP